MNFFLSPHQNPRRRGWLSQGKNGRDPLGGTDFCLDLTSLGVTNFGGCRKGVDQKELKFNNFTENNLHYQIYSGTPSYGDTDELDVNFSNAITVTVTTTSGNYSYINSTASTDATNTFTLPAGSVTSGDQIIRVVVQDGTTKEAFITYFKLE